MGIANSKADNSEALRLCKERKRFIKKAIDSRYNFAASHVAYTQSLRNIGIALRRFAEAEVLIESSLSTSATELDKTPSHSYYPSPSPSHIGGGGVSDSPLPNESPLSPPVARVSYMRSGGSSAVTVNVNPNGNNNHVYVDDGESMTFSMPPPPPPPHHMSGSSWDFFDPVDDDAESFRFVGHDGYHVNFDNMSVHRHVQENEVYLDGTNGFNEEPVMPKSEQNGHVGKLVVLNSSALAAEEVGGSSKPTLGKNVWNGNGSTGTFVGKTASEQSGSRRDKALVEKDVCGEREDPSEFITHRAKDFLSSIKDIEHRFFRASECGKEVARMLEVNKIRVGYFEAKGSSPASAFLTAFHVNCCTGKTALVSNEPAHVTKVITWNRSTSSRSSSSRNPLATASKDDNDDSGSDFIEEFCMIAGSHSSTLDRLYAWERKLYDEVKASESIRKVYDQKCDQLRHQFAKDLSAQVIDKTRSVVKDLHSRIIVALHAVDSISKRIEKMRDEELQPQLVELTQGLIRMWKAMLECHHAQYITISLAYHAKSSNGAPLDDSKRQIMTQLQHEIECFGVSFADLVNSHTSYVEALNGWLQHCILQPRERTKGRRAFSPRRVLAPPIFVLCRDWSAGIQGLPSEELSDAIKAFLSDLHHSVEQAAEELRDKQKSEPVENGTAAEEDKEEKNDDRSSNLSSMHTSLAKLLDRLTKFSEASLKMYEDIRQKCETARNAYSNYRPPPRAFSI